MATKVIEGWVYSDGKDADEDGVRRCGTGRVTIKRADDGGLDVDIDKGFTLKYVPRAAIDWLLAPAEPGKLTDADLTAIKRWASPWRTAHHFSDGGAVETRMIAALVDEVRQHREAAAMHAHHVQHRELDPDAAAAALARADGLLKP